MVLGPLAFLSLLGLPLVLGAAILRAFGIGWRTDRLGYAAWAYGAGSLAVAGLVYGWLWTGTDLSDPRAPVTAGVLAALVLFLWGRRRRPVVEPPARLPPGPRWERGLFGVALALVLAVTLERVLFGSTLAIVGGDEGSFWSFRAKVLFHLGGFGTPYAELVARGKPSHPDYPLFNSLLQVWTFSHAGRITHAVNRIPVQLFSVALVLALAAGLRRVVRPALAAPLLVLLPAMEVAGYSPLAAYSDVIVALGALLLLDGYLRWRAAEGAGRPFTTGLALVSLGSALAVASKHEGMLLVAAAVAAFVLVRWRRPDGIPVAFAPARLAWLLPALAIGTLTWFTNAWHGFGNSVVGEAAGGPAVGAALAQNLAERLGPTLRYLLLDVLLDPVQSQLLLPFLLVMGLTALALRWDASLVVPACAALLTLLGLVAIFVCLPARLEWYLDTAAARLAFQMTPAAVLGAGAAAPVLLAGAGGSRMARLLGGLLVLTLTWRVLATAPRMAADLIRRGPSSVVEAATRSEEERLTAALGRLESARGKSRGEYVALHRAILEHVPAGASVHAISGREHPLRGAISSLQITTYPRWFFRRARLPEAAPSARVQDAYVLDFEGSDRRLAEFYQLVEAGAGWKLWR